MRAIDPWASGMGCGRLHGNAPPTGVPPPSLSLCADAEEDDGRGTAAPIVSKEEQKDDLLLFGGKQKGDHFHIFFPGKKNKKREWDLFRLDTMSLLNE
ncbi:hypothetical protein CDAR_213741 [Caerostris darwini]|uniref:Uncharacterized protein n=1 Tax=Caerostris darwini TaxID=1538125 RepID=A0AAV4X2R6_9ARAC|nr:hypothetical protein CDAR_213741 [Caerostris darwini]